MVVLDEKSKMPLYAQLYQQIKEDILSGSMKAGAQLPSSRKLAMDLRVSRNTVELAYAQLTSEGFLKNVPRQGCYVEVPFYVMLDRKQAPEAVQMESAIQPDENTIYDFQNKGLHSEEFPFDRWQKLTNKCFLDHKTGF